MEFGTLSRAQILVHFFTFSVQPNFPNFPFVLRLEYLHWQKYMNWFSLAQSVAELHLQGQCLELVESVIGANV
jgi:hypothetical protein